MYQIMTSVLVSMLCSCYCQCLTTYSDACWGSQIGNAIREGIQLPLFKFRSMSGAIIFRSGGSITWKTDRQERTSLSSCEAEIRATNMGSRLTVNVRNMILHLASTGYPITDAQQATPLYNDNEACVKWCHNLTTKGNRHIEHRENATREWVEDGTITVTHVSGKCNPSDIFTKEMRDGSNFRRIRDSFMSRASTFLKGIYNSLHPLSAPHLKQPLEQRINAAAQAAHFVPPPQPGLLESLLSHPSFSTPEALSCLSPAGRYLAGAALIDTLMPNLPLTCMQEYDVRSKYISVSQYSSNSKNSTKRLFTANKLVGVISHGTITREHINRYLGTA